ncbi:LarC family nickel insertion protein [Priestia megaterium]|uniref:LarC family nickel insertion protein n=1 Tax=Priestia megaterium TaxID=1404 RepID=UPI001C212CBE|nr:LarC family nickel insertion protein [Priestia megaterium]MBU8687267.1 LarC family nickel insertion protein [Priestia megaterium]
MRTLYLDCFSGISGDMFIGALIDAGGDSTFLEEELQKLNISEEYKLSWKKVVKNGISSTKFDVELSETADHKYASGHQHNHKHEDEDVDHNHEHEHEHSDHHHKHEHSDHHEHSHHHSHRAYQDIVKLIERSQLSQKVKETSLNIFRKIGEAEGLIHGISLEKVHFHEVGAVDSIIDIVGASILINKLEIQKIKSSPVCVGAGKVHIDHGIYPIPAPATLEILKGVPLQQSNIKSELTTPTGAAIVSVLSEEFCTVPSMTVQSVGYGAGTKDFEKHPNVLRVIIGEEA